MKKQVYMKPEADVIELIVETEIIAGSGQDASLYSGGDAPENVEVQSKTYNFDVWDD